MKEVKLGSVRGERLVLGFVLGVFGVLAVYRAIHLWITGFYVSDEFSYVMTAIKGVYMVWGHPFTVGRPLFLNINYYLFQLFGISNGTEFAIFLPFYLTFWNSLTVLSAYGILKSIGLDSKTVSATLLGMVFLVSPVVLSLGFLSEVPSVAMAMLGIYLLLKLVRMKQLTLLLASFFIAGLFGATGFIREPYRIFVFAGSVVVFVLSVKNNRDSSFLKRLRESIVSKRIFRPTRIAILLLPLILFVAGYSVTTFIPAFTTYQPYVNQGAFEDQKNSVVVTIQTVTSEITQTIGMTCVTFTEVKTVTITSTLATLTHSTPSFVELQFLIPLQTMLGEWGIFRFLFLMELFFVGLAVGFNPILALVSVIGYVLMFKGLLKTRTNTYMVTFICASASFLMYLAISAMISSDPNFVIFKQLSVITRFSEMLLPAFVLSAPFAFRKLGKKATISLFLILIVFSAGASGTYQRYMQTHLSTGYPYSSGQQIFNLDYRTPFGILRDSIASHPEINSVIVFAEADPNSYYDNVTLHWQMIPWTEHLEGVKFYSYIPESEFLALKPERFYVYYEGPTGLKRISEEAPYLLEFVAPTGSRFEGCFASEMVYHIHSGIDSTLVLVVLEWKQ